MESKKVMIVDDSLIMRRLIKKFFTDYGCTIVGEADNGYKAIETYLQLKPDVVTMDMKMPVMDGVDAVKEIIKLDPNAQIIMISSEGDQDKVLEAIQNGAKNYILKPLQMKKIVEAMEKLFG